MAARKLREALALWRGAPLSDLAYEPRAQAEIARLDELHTGALEQRIEADLALGRHSQLVGELERLVEELPLREGLRGQLMLCLYRCGRQAEALEVYRATREVLVDELGIEPGRELRELEQAILRQDPALDLPAPETAGEPERESVGREIRGGRAALEGERKQVTILFADVVESLELAEQTDPEEWRRVVDRLFSILCEGVNRFEGTVDKFTGDGIMALFGAPVAHEDHARRACSAALYLQGELAAYAEDLRAQGLRFSIRIGLNSGVVVAGAIGEDLAMEYTAVGHTVGLARRIEQLAAPDTIYVSEHTASLVEGYLALVDRGEFQVKGASGPLRLFELTGVGAARGTLDVSRSRGFARFVGRNSEMGVLESALEQALSGRGQVIGVAARPASARVVCVTSSRSVSG